MREVRRGFFGHGKAMSAVNFAHPDQFPLQTTHCPILTTNATYFLVVLTSRMRGFRRQHANVVPD